MKILKMYITENDINVICEAEAFIEGQLDGVEDEKYWHDFLQRFQIVRKKAEKQYNNQQYKAEINKRGRALANER